MGISPNEATMEGWLYTIRSNRFGLQFPRKRYFILHNTLLRSFKTFPTSENEQPVRSAVIDSYIRVADDGRESINKKVFFIFTIYSTSDINILLKLGASSSEEAAAWIHCLKDSALKASPCQANNSLGSPKNACPFLRSQSMKTKDRKNSFNWPFRASVHAEAMTSDVTAPSSWKIFDCQNGLRLFKEAKVWDSHGGHWDDHPAIMAVSMVDGTSEAIFLALMSIGPSRSEWDFCFYHGSVVECLDGHTDIIHKKLYSDWLPWGMKRRDLLLQRNWRREDDGTYVILYHSVVHKKCPPQSGYVRAHLKSGGYVITPVNQGQQSIVKHMLAIDWKFWKFYLRPSAARSLTISMLKRVAALRELFKGKKGNYSSKYLSREWLRHIHLPQTEKPDNKIEDDDLIENEVEKPASASVSLMDLNEESDEFFDVPEASEFADDDQLESEWYSEPSSELCPSSSNHPEITSAAGFVRKLHDLATQKNGYMDLQEVAEKDTQLYCFGNSLQEDPTSTLPCSWSAGDSSWFLIRGKNYLQDNEKITANGTLMQMVGADWLISDKREDDLGSRQGGIVQKHAAQAGLEFFFIVNFQIPGKSRYTLAMYYMIKSPLEDHPLLYKFVNGDDAFRNSRFKLIPCISQGSWIARKTVRKRASLLGQSIETHYFRGKNYMEVDIDVGSSAMARGAANFLLGYLNTLVLEMAFIIQGDTPEELPETLIGTCRLNHVDPSKALLTVP
ncbi:hypothetical protein V6N13_121168 [Hibiscus sabdariffa]|uniref:Protein ENHANCED DISEASE RESISTANCE 2-like n=1 Tax=Hibiscus sabdariffa TaxID=183260 RepID=A0ABR2EA02_9ROSI